MGNEAMPSNLAFNINFSFQAETTNSNVHHTTEEPKQTNPASHLNDLSIINNNNRPDNKIESRNTPVLNVNDSNPNKTKQLTTNDSSKKQNIYCSYGQSCKYKETTCKKIHKLKILCPNEEYCRKSNVPCIYMHLCKKGSQCDRKETCFYYHPMDEKKASDLPLSKQKIVSPKIDLDDLKVQGLKELCKQHNLDTYKCSVREDYVRLLRKSGVK
jgi:hypothetical protein